MRSPSRTLSPRSRLPPRSTRRAIRSARRRRSWSWWRCPSRRSVSRSATEPSTSLPPPTGGSSANGNATRSSRVRRTADHREKTSQLACSTQRRGLESRMPDALVDRGNEIKEEMFGPEHGRAKLERQTDFTRPFEELVCKYCFAEVWG